MPLQQAGRDAEPPTERCASREVAGPQPHNGTGRTGAIQLTTGAALAMLRRDGGPWWFVRTVGSVTYPGGSTVCERTWLRAACGQRRQRLKRASVASGPNCEMEAGDDDGGESP